jgi:L,D-peptidoglycan transpeptidase YkuD (ErfK/YbiS/YcfS/YnhG family)
VSRNTAVASLVALAAGCLPAEAEPPPPAVTAEVPPPAAPPPPAVPPRDPGCPVGLACDLAAWSRAPRPVVTEVLIEKRAHRLHLVAGRTIVRSYGVALGSGGLGQKLVEGDRVTPIGAYHITGRYPSKWHTYLALDYPNAEDRRRYAELVARGEVDAKKGPGSAIAIHGHRADMRDGAHKLRDWTLGCVALDRDEIDEVADAAPVGTRVVIEE